MSKESTLSGITPDEIISSVADIPDLVKFTRGELVLPLQEPQLERKYVEAITGYFNYTKQALTDPGIVRFMRKHRIGIFAGEGSPLLVNWTDFTHKIAGGKRSYNNFVCLVTEPGPELVFSTQALLELSRKETDMKSLKNKWQSDIQAEFKSRDENNDWRYLESSGSSENFAYVCAYRTMGPGDLLIPGMLPDFVRGVTTVFERIKYYAEDESAVKFDSMKNIENITKITDAFNKANRILQEVFPPSR